MLTALFYAARAVTSRKKVLVFDECYHGTMDDTMLNMIDGKVISRQSLLGQMQDLTLHSIPAPFNDLATIERQLAKGNIVAILTSPR